jgi:hypothetical protein
MGILASYVFKTIPGGFSRHVAIMLEGRDRLQKMGYRAGILRPVSGSESGALATVISYENAKAWAEGSTHINTDPDWMQFYAASADAGVAEQIEAALFSDVDPDFKPAAYGAQKVFRNTTWQPIPGKAAGLMESIQGFAPFIAKHGGSMRVMQCMEGTHPLTIGVSIGFDTLAAAGANLDSLNADPEFQAYWAGVMAHPTAHLVSAGTYQLVD